MIRLNLRPYHFPFAVAVVLAIAGVSQLIQAAKAPFDGPPELADLREAANLAGAAGSFIWACGFTCAGLILRELRLLRPGK